MPQAYLIGIGASIRIGREILCFPYAGFFNPAMKIFAITCSPGLLSESRKMRLSLFPCLGKPLPLWSTMTDKKGRQFGFMESFSISVKRHVLKYFQILLGSLCLPGRSIPL